MSSGDWQPRGEVGLPRLLTSGLLAPSWGGGRTPESASPIGCGKRAPEGPPLALPRPMGVVRGRGLGGLGGDWAAGRLGGWGG